MSAGLHLGGGGGGGGGGAGRAFKGTFTSLFSILPPKCLGFKFLPPPPFSKCNPGALRL